MSTPSFESHDIDSLETAVDDEHSLDFETLTSPTSSIATTPPPQTHKSSPSTNA
jgi:hypothetical protein